MTQEEKELLLKDLCGRLPYGVKALETYYEEVVELITICPRTHNIEAEILSRIGKDNSLTIQNIQFFKPCLRPMSSMTEEEINEYLSECDKDNLDTLSAPHYHGTDWLNKKMFDYRGLIEKGLALKAPEEMYNTKN